MTKVVHDVQVPALGCFLFLLAYGLLSPLDFLLDLQLFLLLLGLHRAGGVSSSNLVNDALCIWQQSFTIAWKNRCNSDAFNFSQGVSTNCLLVQSPWLFLLSACQEYPSALCGQHSLQPLYVWLHLQLPMPSPARRCIFEYSVAAARHHCAACR